MAFGFVKQSGGYIAVSSEVGVGTTFHLYLPRGWEKPPEAVVQPDEPEEATGDNRAVLLVEDNEPLRLATARQLRDLGYRVREAGNSDAALSLLRSNEPLDLLFSDVVMPGQLDGMDLADEAKRLRPGLAVLLTSGFARVQGGRRRLEDSPFTTLKKPYSRQDLAQKLRAALAGRSNR
jgi:CheY-like chemotaxis protein